MPWGFFVPKRQRIPPKFSRLPDDNLYFYNMVHGKHLGNAMGRLSMLAGRPGKPLVIAGPCSAESREQVLEAANQLAVTNRVSFLRAGLWKPRTRPNSFEGLGEAALPWMMEAQRSTGLIAMTEVATPKHVETVLKAGMQAIWIGARTTVSPFAVQALADALKGVDVTVLVKNPMHADLKLWMGAIERIRANVTGEVGALHRGFSSYGRNDFRNAPMWEIPIALKAEMPQLPMLCDPSHIAGCPDLLQEVAQRAMNLGMEGLMIESHPDPSTARSDAEQQIKPSDVEGLLSRLDIPSTCVEASQDRDDLEGMRLQIDSVDEQLMQLLSQRMELAKDIGALKHRNRWSLLSVSRWRDIIASRTGWGTQLGLSRDFLAKILTSVHEESIRVQGDKADEQRKKRNKNNT
jgi:chorismate mutase